MTESHKKIAKKYVSLPFENEVGLSTFDIQLMNRDRKRYVPVFNRKEQIFYPDDVKAA